MITAKRAVGKLGKLVLLFAVLYLLHFSSMKLTGFPKNLEEVLERSIFMALGLWVVIELFSNGRRK